MSSQLERNHPTAISLIELVSETTERARALVRKGKNAPRFVVQAQLVALIEVGTRNDSVSHKDLVSSQLERNHPTAISSR